MKSLLILTATINPGDMIYVKRSDPIIRLGDYLEALRSWIERYEELEIVFCENSMYQLDQLYKLAQKYHSRSKVHFLQFDGNNYPHNVGKSYGEAKIINYVLDNLERLDSYSYLIKCTGRIFVPNLYKILGGSIDRADFVSELPKTSIAGHRYIISRIFAGNLRAFREIFRKFEEQVNDNESVYFEQVLAQRLRDQIEKGLIWLPFEALPRYIGISGTSGHSLNKPIEYYIRSKKYQLMLNRYRKSVNYWSN